MSQWPRQTERAIEAQSTPDQHEAQCVVPKQVLVSKREAGVVRVWACWDRHRSLLMSASFVLCPRSMCLMEFKAVHATLVLPPTLLLSSLNRPCCPVRCIYVPGVFRCLLRGFGKGNFKITIINNIGFHFIKCGHFVTGLRYLPEWLQATEAFPGKYQIQMESRAWFHLMQPQVKSNIYAFRAHEWLKTVYKWKTRNFRWCPNVKLWCWKGPVNVQNGGK